MKIVLASRNKHKIAEIHTILSGVCPDVEVMSLDDIGIEGDIEENGDTFEKNSEIKASVAAERGFVGMADDSGLEVDALDGAPGVYSARYSGEPCDDKRNNRKLLDVLGDLEAEKRTAHFVSVISIVFPKGSPYYDFDSSKLKNSTLVEADDKSYRGFCTRGECPGHILFEERGNGGFGYDPLFLCDAYNKTFAELNGEEKNKVSHRGNAMRLFAEDFAEILR